MSISECDIEKSQVSVTGGCMALILLLHTMIRSPCGKMMSLRIALTTRQDKSDLVTHHLIHNNENMLQVFKHLSIVKIFSYLV